MDPQLFGNLDSHPDPHLSDKLDPEPDPDPHQFADDKPKRMEHEPIWTLFQEFQPLFGSKNLDPDPHQSEKSEPDPHQIKIRIRIRIRMISRIRICFNVMRIHNTGLYIPIWTSSYIIKSQTISKVKKSGDLKKDRDLVGTWKVSRCLKNWRAQKVFTPSFSNRRSTRYTWGSREQRFYHSIILSPDLLSPDVL